MAEDKSSTTKGPAKAERQADKANEQVQKAVDHETDNGFRGVEVDQTPNENYTVKGVTSGADVPEAAADPVVARREASGS